MASLEAEFLSLKIWPLGLGNGSLEGHIIHRRSFSGILSPYLLHASDVPSTCGNQSCLRTQPDALLERQGDKDFLDWGPMFQMQMQKKKVYPHLLSSLIFLIFKHFTELYHVCRKVNLNTIAVVKLTSRKKRSPPPRNLPWPCWVLLLFSTHS